MQTMGAVVFAFLHWISPLKHRKPGQALVKNENGIYLHTKRHSVDRSDAHLMTRERANPIIHFIRLSLTYRLCRLESFFSPITLSAPCNYGPTTVMLTTCSTRSTCGHVFCSRRSRTWRR